MAKISKNGNLSGTIGKLVFVNSGDYHYVRSKPAKVKQSQKSKAAAALFGWMSGQDKIYREAIKYAFSITTDRYYSARHRARIMKSVLNSKESPTNTPSLTLGTPETLIGFDFNAALPWQTIFRSYPQFTINKEGVVECKLPTLHWGEHIKPPKGAVSASLKLQAFTTDPDQKIVEINLVASHTLSLNPSDTIPEALWVFNAPNQNAWLIVLGTLSFGYTANIQVPPLNESAAYLWAKGLKAKTEM